MRSNLANFLMVLLVLSKHTGYSQPVPSEEELIPFACTFSKESDLNWGDDDFVQTFFFVVPEDYSKPLYIRIFDPDIGGKYDENHGPFNSRTKFSVYGGHGAHSNPDAKNIEPKGNFRSGTLLASKVFDNDPKYDNGWYTFGPINPKEGELQPSAGGRVIKLIIEGLGGDDGNLYRIFLSNRPDANSAVEGANAFAYEYTFRISDEKESVAHLYPFVPPGVTAVRVMVFDYDDEGMIRIVSVAKKGDICKLSGDESLWLQSRHRVSPQEINTSLDLQFIKQKAVKNNNVVVSISNQYGEAMPFYVSPIGGIPKYIAKIGVQEDQ